MQMGMLHAQMWMTSVDNKCVRETECGNTFTTPAKNKDGFRIWV